MSTIHVEYTCLSFSGWGYSSKYIISLSSGSGFATTSTTTKTTPRTTQTNKNKTNNKTNTKQLFTSSYIPTLRKKDMYIRHV